MYAIKKNGKYVKDFSNGTEFTTLRGWNWIEKYTTKKAALVKAQEYSRNNGKGYSVVEI